MTILVKNKHTLQVDDFKFRCCIDKKGSTANKKKKIKKQLVQEIEMKKIDLKRK